MTASRDRRTRSTWIAISFLIMAIFAAGALSLAGVRTLADSRAGREADDLIDELATQRLPFTPTALVGTVDDTGRLTSVVVMAIEPDGTGGSIVELAASADANSGNEDVLMPLNLVLATQGPEVFGALAEALGGVGFDVIELVDQRRFAQLITPLGDIPVTFPTALYDASTGERWAAEPKVLSGAEAARAVTSVDPAVDDYLFEPARAAVWRGVADRVGAGIGSAQPVASDADLPRPPDLDQFVARLFAGAVQFRAIGVRPIDAERVATQLSVDMAGAFGPASAVAVSVHDRAEMLMVMGAVAPGRVGAPLDAPSFRVTSGFVDTDLDPLGVRNSDVLNQAIDRLLFAQVNVVSVAQLPGSAVPEHSVFVVADPATIDGVRQQYEGIFGTDIDVRAAEVLIDGVDIELILGRDFLTTLSAPAAANVESSGDDASTETSESDG
jgi:hypothetical protein